MTRVLSLSGSLRHGSSNTAVLEAARRLAPAKTDAHTPPTQRLTSL